MLRTILSGRAIKLNAQGKITSLDQAVRAHQRNGYWLLGVTIVYILLVESKRKLLMTATWDWLFLVHLPCAILFFLILGVIVAHFNGLKSAYHPLLGRACATFFTPAAVTGVFLIIRMKV